MLLLPWLLIGVISVLVESQQIVCAKKRYTILPLKGHRTQIGKNEVPLKHDIFTLTIPEVFTQSPSCIVEFSTDTPKDWTFRTPVFVPDNCTNPLMDIKQFLTTRFSANKINKGTMILMFYGNRVPENDSNPEWKKAGENLSASNNQNLAIYYVLLRGNKTDTTCNYDIAASPKVPTKNAEEDPDPMRSFSKTSVLFVSVSFIILMVISLAWLVFYYVQRFRYAHAKDRLARRLFNAAKKALSKMATKSLKAGDKELETDCPVCIEPYHQADVIRILPCKHVFHKTCVDPWLLEHRTCPMCKMDILKAFGYTLTHSCDSVRVAADPDRLSGGGNSSDGRESSGGVSFSAYPFTGAATDSDLHDPFFPSPAPSPPLVQQVLHEGQAQGFSIIPLTVHSSPSATNIPTTPSHPPATTSHSSGSSSSSHGELATAKITTTGHRKRPSGSRGHHFHHGRRQYSAEVHPPPPLLNNASSSSSAGSTSGSGGASCESSGSEEDLGAKSAAVSESLFTPRAAPLVVGPHLAQLQSKLHGRPVIGKNRKSSLSLTVGPKVITKKKHIQPTAIEAPNKTDDVAHSV